MPAPSITGSVVAITSNASSGSQSVTVPADATFALVLTAFWEAGVPDYSTLTLNSVGFTKVVENASDTYECSNIYRLANPATGDRTFAWSWASAPDEGAHIFVVFLKDVDTSAPITGSNYGQAAPSSGSSPSLPTGSFDSTTNDLCVMVASCYGATAGDGSVLGQTEVADGGVYNSTYGLVATKAGVSGTTTMNSSWTGSGMSGSACAVSVAGSTGVTLALDPAAATATPIALANVDAPVTRVMDTVAATVTGIALTVSAPAPSATVILAPATATVTGIPLDVVPGAMSITLDPSALTAVPIPITVSAPTGGISVTLDTA